MWSTIYSFFSKQSPEAQAALIAAFTALVSLVTTLAATPVRYWIDKKALRHKLHAEYEYEQRKKLRDLLAEYMGRVVEAATNMNYRMWNLYGNQHLHWLSVNGDYVNPGNYYFLSFVHRFLATLSIARRFERDALYIDARIADSGDLEFLKYMKALTWAVTNTELFDGLNYDRSRARDHFFNDRQRATCDVCCNEKGDCIAFREFEALVARDDGCLTDVLSFFDGLCADEPRLRWDRLVVLSLLLMALINTFGYSMQKSKSCEFEKAASEVRNPEVLINLARWLPKLGLGKSAGGKLILRAIRKVNRK